MTRKPAYSSLTQNFTQLALLLLDFLHIDTTSPSPLDFQADVLLLEASNPSINDRISGMSALINTRVTYMEFINVISFLYSPTRHHCNATTIGPSLYVEMYF